MHIFWLMDVELTDDDDKTPIDYATEYKHYAVFDYLKSQEVAEFTSGTVHSLTSQGVEIQKQKRGNLLSEEDKDALQKLFLTTKIIKEVPCQLTFEKVQRLLYDNGYDELAASLRLKLNQVIKEQHQHLEILKSLMTCKKTVDIQYLKVFLVGPPGVGKTTTLNRLLKVFKNISCREFQNEPLCSSTLLVNFTQVFATISKGTSEWLFSTDVAEEAKLVFACLHRSVSTPKSCIETQVAPQQKKVVTFSEGPKQPLPTSRSVSPEVGKQQMKFQHQGRLAVIHTHLQRIIKSGDYSRMIELSNSTLLNVNDVGGQPGFLEMLPALSTGPALYLIFFDLSQDVSKPVKIPFNRKNTIITPYEAIHTVEATISQILSAIASVHYLSCKFSQYQKHLGIDSKFKRFQNIKPLAVIIGTHKDKVKDEKVKEVDETLKKVTKNFQKILVYPPGSSASFLSIDNYEGTEVSDIGPMRDIINKIIDIHFKESTLPIHPQWLIFSSVLRTEYKIATIEECTEIGGMLQMDINDVKFCLWYLDCIGTIMYYPNIEDEWFRNHVICFPQVIFDSISQLVVASLRKLHCNPAIQHEKADLIERGQFSIKTLEKYCYCHDVTEKLKKNELIPIKCLIKFLDHVNILSPIIHPESEEITYLMPSVLECASLKELSILPQADINPLCISFKCGYVPTGSFCGLISWLVSNGPYKILGLKWKLHEERVKRNLISFVIDDVHRVLLLCHERYFEIHVTRGDSQITLHDLCTHILCVILFALNSLYEDVMPQLAFRCQCSKHRPNQAVNSLCILVEGTRVRYICEKTKKPVKLKPEHQVWFGKFVNCGEDAYLSLPKIGRHFRKMEFHWSRVVNIDDSHLYTPLILDSKSPNFLFFKNICENDFGDYKCVVKESEKVILTVYRALYKSRPSSCTPNLTVLPKRDTLMSVSRQQPEHSREHEDSEKVYKDLEKLIMRYNIRSDLLNHEIEEKHVTYLAEYFDNVMFYVHVLELTNAEKEDIKQLVTVPGNQAAMSECLMLWKKHNPFNATLRALLTILLKLKKESIAAKLCEFYSQN